MEEFLNSLGLNKYVATFKEQEIDFDVARKLTDDELKELGLPLGPRKKFLEAIQSKASPSPSLPPSLPPSATVKTTTPTATPKTTTPSAPGLTPVDVVAASQDTDLPLDTRKDIQKCVEFVQKMSERLNKATGMTNYFLVVDYVAWYKACENLKGFLDSDSQHVKKQLGTSINEYIGMTVSNLERFCKDQMNRDTMNAKLHRRAIVIEPPHSQDKVKPKADSNQVVTLSIQDGAFHCTISRFLSLSGCYPHISPLF